MGPTKRRSRSLRKPARKSDTVTTSPDAGSPSLAFRRCTANSIAALSELRRFAQLDRISQPALIRCSNARSLDAGMRGFCTLRDLDEDAFEVAANS